MPLTVPHFAEASRPPGSRGLAGGRGALHRRPELLSQLADWTSGGDKQAAASLLGYHRQTRAGEARDGAASSAGFPGVGGCSREPIWAKHASARPDRAVDATVGRRTGPVGRGCFAAPAQPALSVLEATATTDGAAVTEATAAHPGELAHHDSAHAVRVERSGGDVDQRGLPVAHVREPALQRAAQRVG